MFLLAGFGRELRPEDADAKNAMYELVRELDGAFGNTVNRHVAGNCWRGRVFLFQRTFHAQREYYAHVPERRLSVLLRNRDDTAAGAGVRQKGG